jgi:hypothetical protein
VNEQKICLQRGDLLTLSKTVPTRPFEWRGGLLSTLARRYARDTVPKDEAIVAPGFIAAREVADRAWRDLIRLVVIRPPRRFARYLPTLATSRFPSSVRTRTGEPLKATSRTNASLSRPAMVEAEMRLSPISHTRPERRWWRYLWIADKVFIDVFESCFLPGVFMTAPKKCSLYVQMMTPR